MNHQKFWQIEIKKIAEMIDSMKRLECQQRCPAKNKSRTQKFQISRLKITDKLKVTGTVRM
jgi:hypothetical protein